MNFRASCPRNPNGGLPNTIYFSFILGKYCK